MHSNQLTAVNQLKQSEKKKSSKWIQTFCKLSTFLSKTTSLAQGSKNSVLSLRHSLKKNQMSLSLLELLAISRKLQLLFKLPGHTHPNFLNKSWFEVKSVNNQSNTYLSTVLALKWTTQSNSVKFTKVKLTSAS